MKIALAQINPTVGALEANCARIAEWARRAEARGAGLAIFPEMAICGYPPRDLVEKPEFVAESLEWLKRASRAAPGVVIVCGGVTPAAVSTGKSVHNSALVLRDGEVLFQQSKMLLPTYDVFDELRNFAPAEQQRTWRFAGGEGNQRIAVTICEDAWNDKNYWPKRQGRLLYERDPVAEQLRSGADFLINIAASPYSAGKIGLRQEMLGAIAREYRVPVLFVNQVGGNDQLIFDGSSMVVGADGTLQARAACFEEDMLVVEAGAWRGDVRPAPEGDEIGAMHQALVVGTRDYVHKCGLRRVIVGLSGGVDSAVTAALAVEALGPENVEAWYMPSRYSSERSAADAQAVAAKLGIALHTHSIEPEFAAVLGGLEAELAAGGAAARLARQNLQSRLRGLHLMAVSNLTGALVLTTGNKSEMAVGYCTLYGDMAGGLAVIADVLKTQVYALARQLNRDGEKVPDSVLQRAPTAELEANQRDEDDLPPYDVLDAVIAQYVEDFGSPDAIAERLGIAPELARAVVQRIDRSEFKRQQAAPGLKVSKKAFGMGRRLPIAQGYQAPGTARPAAAEPLAVEKVAL